MRRVAGTKGRTQAVIAEGKVLFVKRENPHAPHSRFSVVPRTNAKRKLIFLWPGCSAPQPMIYAMSGKDSKNPEVGPSKV